MSQRCSELAAKLIFTRGRKRIRVLSEGSIIQGRAPQTPSFHCSIERLLSAFLQHNDLLRVLRELPPLVKTIYLRLVSMVATNADIAKLAACNCGNENSSMGTFIPRLPARNGFDIP